MRGKISRRAVVRAVLAPPPVGVDPDQIAAVFAAVTQQYGSFGRNVRNGLRLSDAQLAQIRKELLTGCRRGRWPVSQHR